jgi:hypothetical protein
MRTRLPASLLIVAVLLLAGCENAGQTTKPLSNAELASQVRAVAAARLREALSSVSATLSPSDGKVVVQVQLGSLVPTRTLDQAAAAILRTAASSVAATTPVLLTFVSKHISPPPVPGSAGATWGELRYDWSNLLDRREKTSRGSIVYLLWGEGRDPAAQPGSGSVLLSLPRGVWENVDLERLGELAAAPVEPVRAFSGARSAVFTAVPTFKGSSQTPESLESSDHASIVEYGSQGVPGRVVRMHRGASGLWYVDSVQEPAR